MPELERDAEKEVKDFLLGVFADRFTRVRNRGFWMSLLLWPVFMGGKVIRSQRILKKIRKIKG